MAIPSIGSVVAGGSVGKAGVVVAARPVAGAPDGEQLVALRVMTRERVDRATAELNAPLPSSAMPAPPARPPTDQANQASAASGVARTPDRLSSQERAIVERMRQTDAQVRQEENAHAGVAGALAGPISYVYQRGPDGRQYAVGGSVPVSLQTFSGDPAEAQRQGAKLAAAAMAATNPSAADLSAAAVAYRFAAGAGPDSDAETDPAQTRSGALDTRA